MSAPSTRRARSVGRARATRGFPAIAALALLPGCGEPPPPPPPPGAVLTRLFSDADWDAKGGGWRLLDGTPAPPLAPVVIAGDERRARIVADGATLVAEGALPGAPSWLDLEVAVLPTSSTAPWPWPRARLTVEARAGERRAPLFDGVPTAGLHPDHFGWAAVCVEIHDGLLAGLFVSPAGPRASPGPDAVAGDWRGATVELRLTVAAVGEGAPADCRVALAEPRLAPRADAHTRTPIELWICADGPTPAELASASAERHPGWRAWQAAGARAVERPADAPADDAALAAWAMTRSKAGVGFEGVVFGAFDTSTPSVDPRACPDARVLLDPWRPWPSSEAPSGDPAFARVATLPERALAERVRALGEARFFRVLVAPRTPALRLALVSHAPPDAVDAGLLRLHRHLAANGRLADVRARFRVGPPDAPARASLELRPAGS